MTRPIVIETRRGEPLEVGHLRIAPEARVLSLRLPWGGWVWNRATAVIVEADGAERRIPLPDPWHALRRLVGLVLLLGVLALLADRAIQIDTDSTEAEPR